MKSLIPLFLLTLIITVGCKKSGNAVTSQDCNQAGPSTRFIVNKPAKVVNLNDEFFIIEDGSIDTKLLPCNLAAEYRVNNLKVGINGEVKAMLQPANLPCCTELLFITKIAPQP